MKNLDRFGPLVFDWSLIKNDNGSGSDFTADGDYTSGAGIQITVRAGKGIINRSAVVGTYYSTGKKKLQYSPIFYAADAQCQEETDVDELGEYVLATTLWRDNYVISGYDFEDVYRDERIDFIKSKRMMVKESWFEILNKSVTI